MFASNGDKGPPCGTHSGVESLGVLFPVAYNESVGASPAGEWGYEKLGSEVHCLPVPRWIFARLFGE